jgi:hypothetical protein
MLEVADIVRQDGPSFVATHEAHLRPEQIRALHDIATCRTAARGGQLRRCDACGALQYSYHSCRNRHCPKCHREQTKRWLDAHRALWLPCPYFLLTFTLPASLRPLAVAQPRAVYGALMTAAAAALQVLAADPRYLGARPGILAVLHTWTRRMTFHPHVHLLVTAGGLAPDRKTWITPRHGAFLVPCRPLAVLFRAKVREALCSHRLLAGVPSSTWSQPWVVHAQHAGTGETVLEYLARYVFRVAITNSRLVDFEAGNVTFRYRDNRSHAMVHATLSSAEFLRRLLQHVLPPHFAKVRHYGLFSNRAAAARDRARAQLLAVKPAPEQTDRSADSNPPPDLCPQCHVGHMLVVETLPPVRSPP